VGAPIDLDIPRLALALCPAGILLPTAKVAAAARSSPANPQSLPGSALTNFHRSRLSTSPVFTPLSVSPS
jgi:hypothetical protein